MLLDVGPEGSKSSRIKMISGLAGVACFSILTVLSLLLVIDSGPICESCSAWPALRDDLLVNGENLVFSTSVKSFGFGLFTKYMLPIQVAGFLLLAAMVGVIILSKKVTEENLILMESITPQHFLILAFLLFGIGFLGVVIRRNLLLVFNVIGIDVERSECCISYFF